MVSLGKRLHRLRYLDHIEADGCALYRLACERILRRSLGSIELFASRSSGEYQRIEHPEKELGNIPPTVAGTIPSGRRAEVAKTVHRLVVRTQP